MVFYQVNMISMVIAFNNCLLYLLSAKICLGGGYFLRSRILWSDVIHIISSFFDYFLPPVVFKVSFLINYHHLSALVLAPLRPPEWIKVPYYNFRVPHSNLNARYFRGRKQCIVPQRTNIRWKVTFFIWFWTHFTYIQLKKTVKETRSYNSQDIIIFRCSYYYSLSFHVHIYKSRKDTLSGLL